MLNTPNYDLERQEGTEFFSYEKHNNNWLKIDTALFGKVDKSIITAANDFIVGSAAGEVVKKTLAETKSLLGVDYATDLTAGVVQIATSAEVIAGTEATKVITPLLLQSLAGATVTTGLSTTSSIGTSKYFSRADHRHSIATASTSAQGIVELATSAECLTGTDTVRAVTPSGLKAVADQKVPLSVFTAANDFIVGSGSGTVVKKTLAETKTLLGITQADILTLLGDTVFKPSNYGFIDSNSASFTLSLSDANSVRIMMNSTNAVVTIPTHAAVPIPPGTQIFFEQDGAGLVTFAPDTNVTLSSKDTKRTIDGRYSSATLIKVLDDAWLLVGSLKA